MRTADALELLKASPFALLLAYVIGQRGRFRPGFNQYNLELGEAMLGDYENYGMSERQYRTAKEQLQKWEFATFRTTNKGTIGKLIDSRLFSIIAGQDDGQNDTQPTGKRRASDGQPTTNEERKSDKDPERANKTRGPRSCRKLWEKIDIKADGLIHDVRSSGDLVGLCEAVLGKDEMARCGSRWRGRAETEPDKLKRVLDEIRAEQREGKHVRNPGAYAEDLWKRFE